MEKGEPIELRLYMLKSNAGRVINKEKNPVITTAIIKVHLSNKIIPQPMNMKINPGRRNITAKSPSI